MKKRTKEKTVRVLDEFDKIIEVTEVGVLGLFQPGEWDINEELENNEALRDAQRECSMNNF